MRLRRRGRFEEIDSDPGRIGRGGWGLRSSQPDPEQQAATGELHRALEAALDTLPEYYRSVLVLREIEGMSTKETAECLDLTVTTVKIRLHRAKASLRKALLQQAGPAGAYAFMGERCDRMVAVILARIR